MENYTNKLIDENGSQGPLISKVINSIVLKIFVVFVLMVILMIPMSLVENLITERKNRENNVSAEIASKWSFDQVLSSPVIAVPYSILKETVSKSDDGTSNIIQTITTEWAFLLTDQVSIKANVTPETLTRGLYKTVVYSSNIKLNGNFKSFNLDKLKVPLENLRWDESKLVFGIQDFKGLTANPTLKWGNNTFEMTKENQEIDLFPKNLYVDLPLQDNESLANTFEISLDLKGSKSLNFLPLANQTQIKVEGSWANPSFNGNYLPVKREVAESFKATWNIPSFNRKKPEQWTGSAERIYHFAGVDLNNMDQYNLSPVDNQAEISSSEMIKSRDTDMVQIEFLPAINNYQKATRVTKYGLLVIALTFVSLVFLEVIKKQRIHIIHYILIGFAMVLFYALLLAISEQLGFNLAYLISAFLTILLISTYIRNLTGNNKATLLVGGILTLFYVFIFILLQLRDYSLIVGTIGIFIILTILMRFATKIDWYQYERKS